MAARHPRNLPKKTDRSPGPSPVADPGRQPAGDRFAGARALAALAGGAARAQGRAALARAAGLAGGLARRALAAATGETGRRLARAAALTVALAVLVGALYDRGEVPSAAARPGSVAPADAAGAPGGSGAAGGSGTHRGAAAGGSEAARRANPDGQGGLRGRTRPSPVGERPAAVAAAWYATRHGVARAKVTPLQQDRLSARQVRVLVLADLGHGRLRTALVRVRRGPDGWRVR
jgi:hypothetical protein